MKQSWPGWCFSNPNQKKMSQNEKIFPNFRGENKKYLSCHHLVTLVHLYLDFHLDLLGRLYRETLVLWRENNCWLMEQLILFSPRFLLLEEQKFIKQKIGFYFVENFERGVAGPIWKLDGACCGSHLSWLIFGGGGPFGATCQENVDPKSVVQIITLGEFTYIYIYNHISTSSDFSNNDILRISPPVSHPNGSDVPSKVTD